MKILWAALIFLCLQTDAAFAYTYTIFGDGTESCATWGVDRQSNNAADDEQFVLGFVSGMGDMNSGDNNTNVTVNTDSNGIYAWIDNYCQKNPTDNLGTAAGAFWYDSNTIQKN